MMSTQPPSSAMHAITPDTGDSELVRRAIDGEPQAFAMIMRRHNQRLFRTARSILKADAEAEEALQEAYLRAWRGLDKFRAQARLSTWLTRIVANEALGRLRRKRVETTSLDEVMNQRSTNHQAALADGAQREPDREATRAQLRRLIESHIDRLPDGFRAVFMLRAVEGMDVREAADSLDIPATTVRTRYFRARRLMRTALARDVDGALDDAFGFEGARCDRIVERTLARGLALGLCAKDGRTSRETR